MRCAVIENGVVVNVVMADDLDAMPGVLLIAAEDAGNVGERWEGGKFHRAPGVTLPAGSVPQRVPMLNAHLELIEAGWMPSIDAVIESMPEPDKSLARAWLAQALTMARDHPLVIGISAAIGKTEAEVDQLFIRAGARDA